MQIKYRAYNKELKIMSNVASLGLNFGRGYTYYENEPVVDKLKKKDVEGLDLHLGALDDRFVLMQWIGLKDKNGKEVYGSDMVSVDNEIYTIKYILGAFALFEDEKVIYNFCSLDEDGYAILNGYIIGNKFENPDLIKIK